MRALPLLIGLCAIALTGCYDIPDVQRESARRTAMPVFMIPRYVPAGPFNIQAYERVHKKYETAILYIEGDGRPYATPLVENFSSTPSDPIGLRIAAQDGAQNVVYLARPCQYRGEYKGKENCPAVFENDARYSEAVIDAYERALDNIKAYHDVTGFDIVGYDGGAAIAALLAARRDDIHSLRTIAGNLDPVTSSYLNKVKAPSKSLNPVSVATSLKTMPQRHFIGKLDGVTPPAVYNSFAQAMGPSSCLSVSLIDNADHEHGWVEQWNTLRTLPYTCDGSAGGMSAEPIPVPFDPSVLDGDKGHRGLYDKR